MSATALLRENPHPSEDEIKKALQGNICRCTGYGCVDAVPVVLDARLEPTPTPCRQAVRDANLEPPSDVHASSDYRAHLAEVLAVRAVDQARGAA